jgi:hypothetical protein
VLTEAKVKASLEEMHKKGEENKAVLQCEREDMMRHIKTTDIEMHLL